MCIIVDVSCVLYNLMTSPTPDEVLREIEQGKWRSVLYSSGV